MAFAPGPTLAWPRSGCAVVALDEHRILVAGGHWGLGSLQTTEILDIRTMAFSPGPSMGSARSFFAAVPVDAQHILVIGGRDAVATTELLDVATMEFSPGPAMRIARYGIAAARLDATSKEPGFVVIGGETLTTRDEDDSEEEEDDDADTICLSSTEVLSVEEHRGAPAAAPGGDPRTGRGLFFATDEAQGKAPQMRQGPPSSGGAGLRAWPCPRAPQHG
eukprot:CAMPEP_0184201904 /NCGR_PEP_ID=MMETSP0976-20121227/8280_1 /TAXON_ID=483370 /ORGANISM="non described non described, Strain CCMP2097" /LENGTH=219 /DNA_ID=CAMNT_0026506443 /DNA_START=20 /DNA_END=677 /DNA_ORIENTATION=-